MSNRYWFGDGNGETYAGTYLDFDLFVSWLREPQPTVHVMNQNMYISWRKSQVRQNDSGRPRAAVIGEHQQPWAYPRPRLFFVSYMGIQYAIVEQSADDAMSMVEGTERYQAWT